MAAIERVTLGLAPENEKKQDSNHLMGMPGLTIRVTTASLSDYGDWNVEELKRNSNFIVTDGSCS